MSDIVYPSGCKPITEDLGADELIRRLKALTTTLQTMGQEEGIYQPYIPLALHLADEHFMTHSSRDVQLLIACCIADVLRVYAPEAPYKDVDQVKVNQWQLRFRFSLWPKFCVIESPFFFISFYKGNI